MKLLSGASEELVIASEVVGVLSGTVTTLVEVELRVMVPLLVVDDLVSQP